MFFDVKIVKLHLVIIRDTAKVARVPSTSCRGKDPVKRGIIFCLWSLSICYAFCPFNNFIFTIFCYLPLTEVRDP